MNELKVSLVYVLGSSHPSSCCSTIGWLTQTSGALANLIFLWGPWERGFVQQQIIFLSAQLLIPFELIGWKDWKGEHLSPLGSVTKFMEI